MKQRIIYDNYNLDEMYDDCRSFLLEEYEPDEITEEEIWNLIFHENDLHWQDEHERLKEFFDGNGPWPRSSHVGRWNGRHAAGHVFTDFDEMFYKAAQDCDFCKIWDENGHFYIQCSHHDGTNTFEIKRITEKAAEMLDLWKYDYNDTRTERELYDIVWNCNLFSGLPHFAHTVYGCRKRENKCKTTISM